MTAHTPIRLALAGALLAGLAAPAAAEGVVNLYSSRHYDTDEALYAEFTAQTGITVNLIEANADELLARIQNEGANSPADVLITVDAGRLWRGVEAEVFAPVDSETLTRAIPAHLRHPDNLWFSFSQRARIIFYDKERVDQPPQSYEELADPRFKGMICVRSSGNIYQQSLMAAMIAHHGAEKAKEWGAGLLANLARDPQGGDTDQLRGIVSGECAIAVSNTYYFARAIRADVSGLSDSIDRIGWVFPNQSDRGTHVNVSGAGVLKTAPNRDNAVKFLEYLASPSAQEYFSAGNDEYPVVAGAGLSPSVARLGLFRADSLNLGELGLNQAEAVRIWDEIGFK
ncbi:MAG: Fe(3+) ABC transporter substrate-binding protein [Rubrimonas sp.]|uniref:Fe(3+) ABC transporter substrate-binding protein n=1 Tax=Rubrimonas sp. TaxID=2036015 RepID=UPI002FDDD32D